MKNDDTSVSVDLTMTRAEAVEVCCGLLATGRADLALRVATVAFELLEVEDFAAVPGAVNETTGQIASSDVGEVTDIHLRAHQNELVVLYTVRWRREEDTLLTLSAADIVAVERGGRGQAAWRACRAPR